MTFKDLQKLVQTQSDSEYNQLLQRLKDKPFWIWDPKKHKQEDIKTKGDCCFSHIIGCQEKMEWRNKSLIMRSYSTILFLYQSFTTLQNTTSNTSIYGLRKRCPGQDIAIKLIKRMKGLFEHKLILLLQIKKPFCSTSNRIALQIHINDFHVMSVNGQPYNAWFTGYCGASWHGEVVIRIPFDDFAGRSAYHCHIMFHGDIGMML